MVAKFEDHEQDILIKNASLHNFVKQNSMQTLKKRVYTHMYFMLLSVHHSLHSVRTTATTTKQHETPKHVRNRICHQKRAHDSRLHGHCY